MTACDRIFNHIYLKRDTYISLQISLTFVTSSSVGSKSSPVEPSKRWYVESRNRLTWLPGNKEPIESKGELQRVFFTSHNNTPEQNHLQFYK